MRSMLLLWFVGVDIRVIFFQANKPEPKATQQNTHKTQPSSSSSPFYVLWCCVCLWKVLLCVVCGVLLCCLRGAWLALRFKQKHRRYLRFRACFSMFLCVRGCVPVCFVFVCNEANALYMWKIQVLWRAMHSFTILYTKLRPKTWHRTPIDADERTLGTTCV